MNERARRLAVIAAAHFAFAGASLLATRPAAQAWERSWLDAAFRLRGGRQTKAPVVLAGIDDKSLAELGSWPWPRKRSAELIEKLTALGAKTIAFDVMFSEPRGASDDRALVDATRRSGRVLHAWTVAGDGLADPIPGLADASAGLVNLRIDGGPFATRCMTTFATERGGVPSLGVAAAARELGAAPADLRKRLPETACLNFRGPRPYALLSAADILKDRLPDESRRSLKDATVFVGFASDSLSYDQWASPFDPKAPGVEAHATVFDNIVKGDVLPRASRLAAWLLIYLAALASAAPFLVSPRAGAGLGAAVVLLASGAAPLGLSLTVAPYASVAAAAAFSYLACLTASAGFRR